MGHVGFYTQPPPIKDDVFVDTNGHVVVDADLVSELQELRLRLRQAAQECGCSMAYLARKHIVFKRDEIEWAQWESHAHDAAAVPPGGMLDAFDSSGDSIHSGDNTDGHDALEEGSTRSGSSAFTDEEEEDEEDDAGVPRHTWRSSSATTPSPVSPANESFDTFMTNLSNKEETAAAAARRENSATGKGSLWQLIQCCVS
jgi:hypothetical protein